MALRVVFDEITASSLVKVDLYGRKIDDHPYGITPASFTIHSVYGIAVSAHNTRGQATV